MHLGRGGQAHVVTFGLIRPEWRVAWASTVAVFCSATAASIQFLHESRGVPLMGLLLGGVAAVAAQWTASRLDQFDASLLVRLLRGLAIVLAIDSCRRALHLLMV